jgi:16S rRNA (cytidine1402-2'-O)-methyltransferase
MRPSGTTSSTGAAGRGATLYLVATPIGNLEDITLRALRVLAAADLIACEDTRTTRVLLERHGIVPRARPVAYHEHNEERAAARLLAELAAGRDVALCSDAGYPGVSDPGYRIVNLAAEAGYRIEAIPGAGAVEPALVCSGLPTSSFTFKGFPPRKPGPRRRFLEQERESPHTLVFFESPRRLSGLLAAAREALGDRRAAVCIELTKRFERVRRGWLSDLAAEFEGHAPRGEVTVVIAGNHPKLSRPPGEPPALPR